MGKHESGELHELRKYQSIYKQFKHIVDDFSRQILVVNNVCALIMLCHLSLASVH